MSGMTPDDSRSTAPESIRLNGNFETNARIEISRENVSPQNPNTKQTIQPKCIFENYRLIGPMPAFHA